MLRLTGGGSFPSNVGSVASPDLQIRYSYLIPGTVGQQPRLAGVYVDGTGLTSNLSGENVFTLVDFVLRGKCLCFGLKFQLRQKKNQGQKGLLEAFKGYGA